MKKFRRLLAVIPLIFLFAIPVLSQDIFNGCDMDGSTNNEFLKTVNRKKNRYTLPDSLDIDTSVSFSSFIAHGDDHGRFDENKAVVIVAWVRTAKWGSKESCNCQNTGQNQQDVHIELVPTKYSYSPRKIVVAEITPRLRQMIFDSIGIPMSNTTLLNTLRRHKVKITGWLLFDTEHVTDAFNTDPGELFYKDNNRATVWEIHPITSLEIIE